MKKNGVFNAFANSNGNSNLNSLLNMLMNNKNISQTPTNESKSDNNDEEKANSDLPAPALSAVRYIELLEKHDNLLRKIELANKTDLKQ